MILFQVFFFLITSIRIIVTMKNTTDMILHISITNLYFLILFVIKPKIKAVIIPNKNAEADIYEEVLSFIVYKAIYELKTVPNIYKKPTIQVKLINNFIKFLFELKFLIPCFKGIG